MKEGLANLTVKILPEELRLKRLKLTGLKEDLITRLAPELVDDDHFTMGCTVARVKKLVIPVTALRSNEAMLEWVRVVSERDHVSVSHDASLAAA